MVLIQYQLHYKKSIYYGMLYNLQKKTLQRYKITLTFSDNFFFNVLCLIVLNYLLYCFNIGRYNETIEETKDYLLS